MTTTALQARSVSPSLTVSDLQRSLRFYKDGLGFSTGEEWKDGDKLVGVMLQSEQVYLMLGQDDFAKGRDRVKGVGVRSEHQRIRGRPGKPGPAAASAASGRARSAA